MEDILFDVSMKTKNVYSPTELLSFEFNINQQVLKCIVMYKIFYLFIFVPISMPLPMMIIINNVCQFAT